MHNITPQSTITSKRELELLAVIKQMREALEPLATCHLPPPTYEECGVTTHFTTYQVIAAKEAFALTPDLSALKEHDARVLENAIKVIRRFKIDWQMCDEELSRMAPVCAALTLTPDLSAFTSQVSDLPSPNPENPIS